MLVLYWGHRVFHRLAGKTAVVCGCLCGKPSVQLYRKYSRRERTENLVAHPCDPSLTPSRIVGLGNIQHHGCRKGEGHHLKNRENDYLAQ